MRARRFPDPSAPTRLALLALALVAGSTAGGALADRDRPLPRRLGEAPATPAAAPGSRLERAVFGVG
jgi:hypothetical protein